MQSCMSPNRNLLYLQALCVIKMRYFKLIGVTPTQWLETKMSYNNRKSRYLNNRNHPPSYKRIDVVEWIVGEHFVVISQTAVSHLNMSRPSTDTMLGSLVIKPFQAQDLKRSFAC